MQIHTAPPQNTTHGIKDALRINDLFSHTSAPWQQRILREFYNRIKVDREWQCLDAGCGVGNNIETLLQYTTEISACDIADRALQFARTRFSKTNRSISFVRADLHTLPYTDASFDLVLCTEALEHVRQPETVLRELRRVTKPNGYIIVSAQNHCNLSALLKIIMERVVGVKNWDAWGTHAHGFENFISTFHLKRFFRGTQWKIFDERGADYLNAWCSWLPFVYRNYAVLDRFPCFPLGKIPIVKYFGMDYFMLVQRL